MTKWIFLGMAIQALLTATAFLIGIPTSFGQQFVAGVIFLAIAAVLSKWKPGASA